MVNAFFHPYLGGTEKHMYELGRRIAREEEVFVYTSLLDGTERFEDLEGMKIFRTKARFYRMPLIYPPPFVLARRVKREISELDRKFDFDVFHLHGRWFPDFGHAGKYAKERKKLFMLTLHNARPLGISTPITAIGALYDELYGKKLLRMADRIIAVSNFVKWDIARYGVDGTKIEVIHNGVDTSFFKPSEKTFREKYSHFDTIFLYLGRLIKQKGLPYLIHAMAEVVRECPRTGLLIAGAGEERNKLEALVGRLAMEKNVAFLGFVPEEQLPNLYSSADAYVLPSLWEVLPISLLEAMACGIPLLVSDAGGNPEVVEDGINGFVVRKADSSALAQKMKTLIADPEMRRRMGKESRRIAVEKFDWDLAARKTLDYYRRSLEEFCSGMRER
jgi:glycosyltransferase involved in cell wall biosynthesis